jgi:hypothetical protein
MADPRTFKILPRVHLPTGTRSGERLSKKVHEKVDKPCVDPNAILLKRIRFDDPKH